MIMNYSIKTDLRPDNINKMEQKSSLKLSFVELPSSIQSSNTAPDLVLQRMENKDKRKEEYRTPREEISSIRNESIQWMIKQKNTQLRTQRISGHGIQMRVHLHKRWTYRIQRKRMSTPDVFDPMSYLNLKNNKRQGHFNFVRAPTNKANRHSSTSGRFNLLSEQPTKAQSSDLQHSHFNGIQKSSIVSRPNPTGISISKPYLSILRHSSMNISLTNAFIAAGANLDQKTASTLNSQASVESHITLTENPLSEPNRPILGIQQDNMLGKQASETNRVSKLNSSVLRLNHTGILAKPVSKPNYERFLSNADFNKLIETQTSKAGPPFPNGNDFKGAGKNITVKRNSCYKWKIDEPEWTLRYFEEEPKGETTVPSNLTYELKCPVPKLDFNIKLVIYPNGSKLYRGCTHLTPECKEKARYDFIIDKRINTPPCCRKHILDIFRHFTTLLKAQNVTHCLISGAVIGWMRNKKMIPYDRDLDLIVPDSFWNGTIFWEILNKTTGIYKHEYELVEDKKVKIFYSAVNRINIDIWPYDYVYTENKTFVTVPYFGFKPQPVKNVFPLKQVEFSGIKTWIPNNPKQYLDTQYGEEKWEHKLLCIIKDMEGNCV